MDSARIKVYKNVKLEWVIISSFPTRMADSKEYMCRLQNMAFDDHEKCDHQNKRPTGSLSLTEYNKFFHFQLYF